MVCHEAILFIFVCNKTIIKNYLIYIFAQIHYHKFFKISFFK